MDRTKRAASKVTDFCRYHLSGDLNSSLQGKVGQAIGEWEEKMELPSTASVEEIRRAVESQKQEQAEREAELEKLTLRNAYEAGVLKQQQWEAAMNQLKEAKDRMLQEHQESMKQIQEMADKSTATHSSDIQNWLKQQLAKETPDKDQQEVEEAQKKLQELKTQQQQIQEQIENLQGVLNPRQKDTADIWTTLKQTLAQGNKEAEQTLLMQQLKASLNGKDEDPNKTLLRALISTQNKTSTPVGANQLKPELLEKLLLSQEGRGENNMAEWLASLNKQEEGESQFTLFRNLLEGRSDPDSEGRVTKVRSGILDRAATNIRRKETWPQQNLGEDWAEEQIEFKHIRFEHLVAGECRTIKTCTEPAQILGRLKLLKRIAYLKLRGFEWPMLRRMYAAILTSIETGEYSWESNFDRFKTTLYSKAMLDQKGPSHAIGDKSRNEPARRRFCRDYNRPEGCPKPSPHTIWSGSGHNATKKLVYHYCGSCLLKGKVCNEHPEGHPECPYRD